MELALLCIKIFVARICDVSLGTVRMILVVKEKKIFATITAFFEVLIWFLVAREALNQATKYPIIIIAYAGGYAAGTLIGSLISSNVFKGTLNVQIITSTDKNKMIETIKENGFGASVISMDDNKWMIIVEANKKHYSKLKKIITEIDPHVFIHVNETKFIEGGFFTK